MPRAIDVSVSLVNFAGASCRSGRDARRTSTASIQRRQQNASDFTTTHKHSLSGAEFPPTRNVAPAPDLKPVPVVSSETDNPHQILPSNPILSRTTIARRFHDESACPDAPHESRKTWNGEKRQESELSKATDGHRFTRIPRILHKAIHVSSVQSVALENESQRVGFKRFFIQIPSTDFIPTQRRHADS